MHYKNFRAFHYLQLLFIFHNFNFCPPRLLLQAIVVTCIVIIPVIYTEISKKNYNKFLHFLPQAIENATKLRLLDYLKEFFFQEMCQRPRFLNDNTNDVQRFQVESGELGDQWLLAAITSLALTPRFLERVVPPDQGFDNSHSYCGVFR